MAALTTIQLARISKGCSGEAPAVDYTKTELAGALQAIEDWFEANRASISSAIDAGTLFSFTNPQKVLLTKYWLYSKFGRE